MIALLLALSIRVRRHPYDFVALANKDGEAHATYSGSSKDGTQSWGASGKYSQSSGFSGEASYSGKTQDGRSSWGGSVSGSKQGGQAQAGGSWTSQDGHHSVSAGGSYSWEEEENKDGEAHFGYDGSSQDGHQTWGAKGKYTQDGGFSGEGHYAGETKDGRGKWSVDAQGSKDGGKVSGDGSYQSKDGTQKFSAGGSYSWEENDVDEVPLPIHHHRHHHVKHVIALNDEADYMIPFNFSGKTKDGLQKWHAEGEASAHEIDGKATYDGRTADGRAQWAVAAEHEKEGSQISGEGKYVSKDGRHKFEFGGLLPFEEENGEAKASAGYYGSSQDGKTSWGVEGSYSSTKGYDIGGGVDHSFGSDGKVGIQGGYSQSDGARARATVSTSLGKDGSLSAYGGYSQSQGAQAGIQVGWRF